MIRVEDVSRSFGRHVALDRASFEVAAGTVVGLVGPNGAGKTTALRVIAGYLDPDRGRVTVAGALGYLPESSPLPPDASVTAYLAWRARLKGVARSSVGAAVARAMDKTAIAEVGARVIGTLSKGFRQRVGLADALVADPPVLVLDEPQSGLDPVQVRELRAVLAALAGTRTILIASHNVAELEALAARIVLIAKGRVIADDTPAALRGDAATLEDAVVARLEDA